MNNVMQMPTMVNPDFITTLAEARKELDRLQMEMMAMFQALAATTNLAQTQWGTLTHLLTAWEANDQAAIMKQLARLHAHIQRAQATKPTTQH